VRHFWLLFVAVTCVNGVIWWRRAQKQIEGNPQLEAGYRRLIRGWIIYGNLPWLVMGAGVTVGGVPTVVHFINLRNGPWVVAWFVTVVMLWALTIIWLFFRRGAEQLIEYPGMLNLPSRNPWVIKAYFLLCLAGGIVGLCAMIFNDIPASGPFR
jgi:hypothetical protein